MYTDRSKHDLDLFLSELPDPPIARLAEAYEPASTTSGST